MPRTTFTTITPLPAGISRETALLTLHDHIEMIDATPTHTSRHKVNPPPEASPEEYHCIWYEIIDDISYFPGYKGKVSFKACFHDLPLGLQTHVYAPLGVDIKEKWTVGGNEPHEPVAAVELGIGAPITGLYLREDVEIKCNIIFTRFVRKQLKDALSVLVARLVVRAQLQEAAEKNRRLTMVSRQSFSAPNTPQTSPGFPPPMHLQQQDYNQSIVTPPSSPPQSGTFPQHTYDPSAYAALTHQQQCPQQYQDQQQGAPRWSVQNNHVPFSQQPERGSYPQYDRKPSFVNELDSTQLARQKARQQAPIELP